MRRKCQRKVKTQNRISTFQQARRETEGDGRTKALAKETPKKRGSVKKKNPKSKGIEERRFSITDRRSGKLERNAFL